MKKRKPLIFVQDFGTYTNEMLVLVGVENKKEVFTYLKRIKAKVDFSKWVLEDFDSWKERIEEKKQKGLFCWNDEVEGTVLLLRPFEDTWEYWEVLLHEIHHAVDYLVKNNLMEKEIEAQAYLFEYLFRSIRRKLQRIE